MAYEVPSLRGTESVGGKHGILVSETKSVDFDTDAGAYKLLVGQPVGKNTTTKRWQPWDKDATDGTQNIKAFVYPEDVQLSASDEVKGVVMFAGEINVGDINLAGLPNSPSSGDFLTEVQTGSLRELGITVRGVGGVG